MNRKEVARRRWRTLGKTAAFVLAVVFGSLLIDLFMIIRLLLGYETALPRWVFNACGSNDQYESFIILLVEVGIIIHLVFLFVEIF